MKKLILSLSIIIMIATSCTKSVEQPEKTDNIKLPAKVMVAPPSAQNQPHL